MGEKQVPWNKDKLVGSATPFEKSEVKAIKRNLDRGATLRDIALFYTAIDTMFRQSDLVGLLVRDVLGNSGIVKEEIRLRQEKTEKGVEAYLFKPTRDRLLRYIRESGKGMDDYLFSGRWNHKPMCTLSFRNFIKDCAESIGLNPELYSGHSTRHTRSVFLEKRGMRAEYRAYLLGTTIENVKNYSERRKALELSKKYPL